MEKKGGAELGDGALDIAAPDLAGERRRPERARARGAGGGRGGGQGAAGVSSLRRRAPVA